MPLTYRVVTAQLLATLAVALICGLAWSLEDARAALLGGVAVVVPAGYYAWRASRERSPQKLLVMGVGKFVLTCVLLALAMVLFKPPPAGFLGGLIVAQLMYVLVPLRQA